MGEHPQASMSSNWVDKRLIHEHFMLNIASRSAHNLGIAGESMISTVKKRKFAEKEIKKGN